MNKEMLKSIVNEMYLFFKSKHFWWAFLVLILWVIFMVKYNPAKAEETGVLGYWNYNYIHPNEKMEKDELKIPKAEELMSMDAKAFAELLDKTKMKALTTLNQVDVTRYYFLQDVARRKASMFADKYKNAILTFNENFGGMERDYSAVGPGRFARKKIKKQEKERVLSGFRENYGIVYFYQETCPYCVAASEILDVFQKRNSWVLERVNVDLRPALAKFYKIKVVPTTILVRKKDKQRFFLTSGTISVMELEDRITNIIRRVEENKNDMETTDYFDPYFYLRPENAVFLERVLNAQTESKR